MSTENPPDSAPEPRPVYTGMTPLNVDGTAMRPASDDEQLPADAPLTPEEVEDEAVRGDFMLRWAVVLIGIMLGCTLINDSSLLVRIRTGEYMQSHGILPPRADVFSTGSEGQSWFHLSWLLDHLLAGVHRVGGESAMTLLTSLGVGGLFYMLSRITLPSVPTWWSSVCAALALVSCFNSFLPGPSLVTLLGAVGTALLLHRWSLREPAVTPWGLVPLFWLWSQSDPNVYVGLTMLLAFGLGETFLQDARAGGGLKGLWTAIGASIAVCLLHPFHWHVFEYPYAFFRFEQPETREYFLGALSNATALADYSPLVSPDFWAGATMFDGFGIALIGIALVAQIVNWKRLHWGWLLVYVGVNALAAASARYLPAASVVNALVATINGQIWYRHTFRQTYSTNRLEVFFSRAGRAVTVLGLFALAYLAVNGSLMGAGGRRVGIGFHPDLVLQIKTMRDLSENQFDDRPFHIYLSQGDQLIWAGKKSFVDSRMSIHARKAAAVHREARSSLIAGVPSADAWKAIFDEYKLTHAIVRTLIERDVVEVYVKFLQRGWFTSRLAAGGMVVYRPDLNAPEFQKFRQAEPLAQILKQVFREKPREALTALGNRAWPRPKGAYDRWLIQPRDTFSEGAMLAGQYATLLDVTPNVQNPNIIRLRTALAMQAIREARSGLLTAPQKASAYRRLGKAALSLHGIDSQWLQAMNPNTRDEFWFRYALSSYYAAQILDPDDFRDHQVLAELCFSSGARDWALYHLEQFQKKILDLDPEAKLPEQQLAAIKELQQFVGNVRKTVREQLGIGGARPKAIQQAVQDGCWRLALELYEEDVTAFGQEPNSQQLIAQLLLFAGRLEESWNLVESLESSLPPPTVPGGEVFASEWRNACAMANLMNGNEDRSIQLWSEDQQSLQRAAADSALTLAPLTIGPPPKVDLRPLLTTTQAFNDLQQLERETQNGIQAALAELVCSRNQAAAKRLQDVLERNPETASRVRIIYYLSLLTDERLELEPPSQRIPVWPEMFAEGDPSSGTPAGDDEAPDAAPEPKPANE